MAKPELSALALWDPAAAMALVEEPIESHFHCRHLLRRCLYPLLPGTLHVRCEGGTRPLLDSEATESEPHGLSPYEQAALATESEPHGSQTLSVPEAPEARLLHWEHARLVRELRGMRVLLAVLRGEIPRAPNQTPEESVLQSHSGQLREENARLSRELRGVEALVAALRKQPISEVADERGSGEAIVSGTVHRMPADGSCLFHSLAFGLEATHACQLRREIADFIEAHPSEIVAGQALQDWILWESNESPDVYAASMRRSAEWGGAVEMAVCSHIKAVDIHVYERVAAGFRRICAFDVKRGKRQGVVNVLFRPGHYDALSVIG